MNSRLPITSASMTALLLCASLLTGCNSGSGDNASFDTSTPSSTTTTPTTPSTTPTIDIFGPSKLTQYPNDNTSLNAVTSLPTLSVVYTESLSTASTATITTAAGVAVTPTPQTTVFLNTLSIKPTAFLTEGTKYIATFKAQDAAGNKAADVVINFTASASGTGSSTSGSGSSTSGSGSSTSGSGSSTSGSGSSTSGSGSSSSNCTPNPFDPNSCSTSGSTSGSSTSGSSTSGSSTSGSSTSGSSTSGGSSSSWWPPAATYISDVGTKVSTANALPANCASWIDSCWQNSVKDGTVKFVKTSSDSAMVYAYFKSSTNAWYVIPVNYTDSSLGLAGSPVGADLWLQESTSDEVNWVVGTARGTIFHFNSGSMKDKCVERYYDSVKKSVVNDDKVTCP